MKSILILLFITLGVSVTSNAQDGDAKVVALINSASWCPVCKANGPRFEKNVLPGFMKNPDYQIVMNNLSDKDTKAASKEMLEKAGVYEVAKANTATGMVYFIDPETKKVVSQISIKESDEDLKQAFEDALSKT